MKVTFNWLKQYVEFNWSPEELRDRLTMVGIEVEGMQKISGEFDGVVVAQVLSSDKHPNADKLSVCRVADGRGERQIVCGAKNYQVGDKVPLALPGCTLPAPAGSPPFTIKVGKLRGVESQGMMCSATELGLGEDASGLLILPAGARVGQPLAEHLGRSSGDVVYDLEITPNRPDLNSLMGIAREISAVTGNPLRWPELPPPATAPSEAPAERADQWVAVRLEDPDLCPRYTARIVRGVKIGPSPAWLKQALEKIGIRSISNVVDVTNYVMLETGQPLHAFDYRLLTPRPDAENQRPAIVVRRALEGELFSTLDGQRRTLNRNMLVIADETKAVALAGIMGGLNSEIQEQTADVLIESAYFKPQNIRSTSKQLDLRSDASYRFERGCDVNHCDWASRRAVQLILQTTGGRLLEGVVDAYPNPVAPREITLRYARTDQLLGISIPPAEQWDDLRRLGLEPVSTQPGGAPSGDTGGSAPASVTVRVPTFRVDLKREIDLIEEVGRLYGVDRIPSRTQLGTVGAHDYDRVHDQLAEARRLLTGLGLNEAQGQTLVPDAAVQFLKADTLALENPLSADMNLLRPTMWPGLLDALRHNLAHKLQDVALFEIGRAFTRADAGTREERRLAVALTGQRQPLFWSGDDRHAKFDLADLKGLLEEFFEQFGLRGFAYVPQPQPGTFFVESAAIHLGKQEVGTFGQLHPIVAKRYDLRDAVLLAELNFDLLLSRRNAAKAFKPLPAYPAIRRDLAMIVPEATTHESVLQTVKQAKPQNLEQVELFDVFRGKHIPAGQKSMAYAFVYRNAERTLTDAEVNAAHQRVVQQLQQNLQAVVRES
jgi:phenylalanyl-tRNA synthetase beta chain